MNQLILPYQKNVKKTFENFISDDQLNIQIIEYIKIIYSNNNSQLFLWGAKASGKSHIMYAACNYYSNLEKKCAYISLKDYMLFNNDILGGLEDYDLICLDDIDFIFGNTEWEYFIFVLINKILDNSKKVLYTSSSVVNLEKILLKDLHSRLLWGLVFKINASNDLIKEKILKSTIIENEYNISLDVCSYLLKNKNRSLSLLLELIHRIGLHSLSVNKKVNIKNLVNIID